MATSHITVIGSSNTDMVVQSNHLPVPGETVLGGQFSMHPGGKGANQAVAAARLGGAVTFIANVGDDLFGNEAIAGFNQDGIDTQFVSKDAAAASGVALIMVDANGENSISVALGANNTLTTNHIYAALPHLKESAYVLTQLETPLAVVKYLAGLATEHGLKLVLNPAPAPTAIGMLDDELLEALYLLTPNQTEAELLSGIKVSDEASARAAANVLRAKGITTVIITMGSQGAYVLSDELDELVPTHKVKAVDTTAAGDTFNGALVVALSEGQDLRSAIKFANRAAAYSVGILGAQASAPTREQLAAWTI